ncbi:MAG: VWA domain-containing protein [Deltaproteobacteria bacterium]|nr:VWA domain-containing protein [Deltaproteobacteria bacterium]
MFLEFLFALRRRKIPVGAQEAVALASALSHGLHDSSLDGLYQVSRALLIHSEAHLDEFDLAFAEHFRGVYVDSLRIAEDLAAWLDDPVLMGKLTEEEKALIEALDPEELRRQFEERLREQRERHDGGNRWIGTGGTSPFGRSGFNPRGMRVGAPSGGRSAMKSADARNYRSYRSDLVLDVRQIEVALRRLRAFAREGSERELDIDETIHETARNAGELEIVTRPPRRPNTRVILMMDVGGSMDPYAHLVEQLFSAAKRATHWKELRTYYFHNCVYGRVYKTDGLQDPVRVRDLMAECGPHYKLVLVGDALMAPYELFGTWRASSEEPVEGLGWLVALHNHFRRSVWLNPEPQRMWGGTTIEVIANSIPMFPLTLEGLSEAVGELVRGAGRK